ncbi:MAG: c-type cytochrome [Candidatus Eiseniibacteriota bacterium]|jgi:mono/diheme cytochrome c family protein
MRIQPTPRARRALLTPCLVAATFVLAGTSIAEPPAASVAGAGTEPEPVTRGRHLVTTMGCNDCHTPWQMGPNGPGPDMSRMLSGHPESLVMPDAPRLNDGPWAFVAAGTMTAWSGPWGVSFTTNLTPDPETGLGRWSEEEFTAAMRSGRHRGRGRMILPPMPVMNVAALSDDDLHAVFAYLQSIPAIQNRVPDPIQP